MKKITAFVGSPRKNGNTSTLVDWILRSAKKSGGHVEKVFLNELKITPCQGCMKCKSNGNICVIRDDMTGLYQKIQQTDSIIMAAPIYMGYIPAQLKAFMDRWYCFASRSAIEFFVRPGKKALVVLCYATPIPGAYDFVGRKLQYFLTRYCSLKEAGTIIVHGIRLPGDVMRVDDNEETLRLAEKAGQLLADDRPNIKWHIELPGSLKVGPRPGRKGHSGRPRGDHDTSTISKMITFYQEKFQLLFPLVDSHMKRRTGAAIADFGCGPGLSLVDFERRYDVSQLYGIDVNERMIEHARAEVAEANIEQKTKLIRADLEDGDWQVPGGSLDIAFASQLLSELNFPVDFLETVRILLKPDGRLLVFDWTGFSLEEALEIWGSKFGERRAFLSWRRFSRFTTEDLLKIVELSGFRVIETTELPWYGGGVPLHSRRRICLFLAAEPL